MAHWKFDETGGTIAQDQTGSYPGTLSPTGASFVSGGVSGNALSLTKFSNGFVTMGNVLGFTAGDFSVVVWAKVGAGDTTENSFVLSKHLSGFGNGYFLNLNQSSILGRSNKAMFFAGDNMLTPISTNHGQ